MKKTFTLFAGVALLLASCSKDSSDSTPTPTPVTGDGSGKFTFSMDTTIYRVDTLVVSYRGRDGRLQSETTLNRNTWSSPDLIFKTGDSLRANVKAIGELKKTLETVTGVAFENNPTTVAVPVVKSNSNSSNTTVTNATRFLHTSYLLNSY